MNAPTRDRYGNGGGIPASGPACPKCAAMVPADAKWCPACGFTGEHTLRMFEGPPPPLLPLFDAAALWNDTEKQTIESAIGKLRVIYPQFRFHVLTVMLAAETSLPAFGFWLLNTAPMNPDEKPRDRACSVLLLIDALGNRAAVVPGYTAEHWLQHDDLHKALAHILRAWKKGRSAKAVVRFLKSCTASLDRAWKLRGLRRTKRNS